MNSGRGQMLALMSAGGDSENAISVSRTIVRDLRNFLLMDVKYSNRFQIYREAAKFDNTVALALSYVPMTVKNSYVGVSIDPKATKDGFRPTEGFLDNVNQILSEIQFTSKLEEIITSLLQDGIYVGRLHLRSKATVDDSGEVPSFKFEGRIDHMESLPIENVTLVDDETYSNKSDLLRSDWVIRKVDHILVNEGYDSKGKKVGAAPAGNKLNAEVHLFPKEVLIISYQNEHHAQIDQNNRTTFGIWGKSPIDSVMVFIKGKITSFIDFLRWQHNAAPRWHHQLLLKELLNPDNFGGDVEKAKEEATRIFQEHKRSLYYTDDDPNSITYKQSLKSEPDEAFVTTDDINIDFKGGTGSNIQVIDIFQLCDRQISNRFGVSMVLLSYEEGSTYAVGKVSASFMSKMGNGLIRSIEDDLKKFLQNEFLYRGLQSKSDDWENMFLELETDDSEIVEATSLRKEKDAAILGSMASALSALISGGIITADQAFDILQNGPEAIQKMKYTKPEAVKAAPAPQEQPITEGGGSNVPPAQNMGLKMPVISQNNGLLEKAHALEALHTALTTLEMAKDLGSMSGVEKELALGMQASLVSLAKDLQDQGEIPFDDVAEAYEQASIKFGVVPKKHNTTPIYMGEGRSVFRVEDDTGDWYFLRHAGKVVSLGYKMPDVSAWNVEKQFEKAFQKPDGMGNVAWDKAMIDLAKSVNISEHYKCKTGEVVAGRNFCSGSPEEAVYQYVKKAYASGKDNQAVWNSTADKTLRRAFGGDDAKIIGAVEKELVRQREAARGNTKVSDAESNDVDVGTSSKEVLERDSDITPFTGEAISPVAIVVEISRVDDQYPNSFKVDTNVIDPEVKVSKSVRELDQEKLENVLGVVVNEIAEAGISDGRVYVYIDNYGKRGSALASIDTGRDGIWGALAALSKRGPNVELHITDKFIQEGNVQPNAVTVAQQFVDNNIFTGATIRHELSHVILDDYISQNSISEWKSIVNGELRNGWDGPSAYADKRNAKGIWGKVDDRYYKEVFAESRTLNKYVPEDNGVYSVVLPKSVRHFVGKVENFASRKSMQSAEHYKCPLNTVKPGSCECPDDATPSKESAPDRNYRGLGLDAPSKLSGDMQSPDIKELNAILEESNTVKDADQDIKDAVGKYTNGEFHYVNNLLYGAEDELKRQGVEDQKIIETRELVAKLDKIFETSELKHDIVTYRGIGGYAYSKMTDEVRNALQTPGSEIEFPAFLSTSVRSDYAVSFSDVGSPNSIVFEMRLPQGTKATYVATESAFPREMEMLVNRGTRFKVVSEPRIEAISLGRDKFSGDAQPIRTKVITLEALT